MECSNGRIKVVVRSSRVPVGLTQFTMPGLGPIGLATSTRVRSVIFADVLDEPQQRLLEEARRLARASCFDLEVVDLGKQNLFQRAVSRLLHGEGVPSRQGIQLEVKSLSDIETAFNSSIR
jgi:hypothetical protein